MAVKEIIAKISCDECGRDFNVEIDPGTGPCNEWTPFEYAQDAVAGGNVVYPHGGASSVGLCSLQDDKMLCPTCTNLADSKCAKAPEGKHEWTSDPETPRKEYCQYCGEPM